jgi:succinate-semialdehyde dehydrogenase / glutarate-semialdehyde dehydrogenase
MTAVSPIHPLEGQPMASTIVTINPATGVELARSPAMTREQIDAALDAAAAAQAVWAGEDFTVRAGVLRAAAGVLRERVEELALLVTREMGKPLAEARAEVLKCAAGLDFYAQHAHPTGHVLYAANQKTPLSLLLKTG